MKTIVVCHGATLTDLQQADILSVATLYTHYSL